MKLRLMEVDGVAHHDHAGTLRIGLLDEGEVAALPKKTSKVCRHRGGGR